MTNVLWTHHSTRAPVGHMNSAGSWERTRLERELRGWQSAEIGQEMQKKAAFTRILPLILRTLPRQTIVDETLWCQGDRIVRLCSIP